MSAMFWIAYNKKIILFLFTKSEQLWYIFIETSIKEKVQNRYVSGRNGSVVSQPSWDLAIWVWTLASLFRKNSTVYYHVLIILRHGDKTHGHTFKFMTQYHTIINGIIAERYVHKSGSVISLAPDPFWLFPNLTDPTSYNTGPYLEAPLGCNRCFFKWFKCFNIFINLHDCSFFNRSLSP